MLKSTALKHFEPRDPKDPPAINAIATLLGISRQAVGKWGAVIPYFSAVELERLTHRKIKVRHDLYVRGKPTPIAEPAPDAAA